MDFRAVLTVLVLLVRQGASLSLFAVGARRDAVKETIPQIQDRIQSALNHLDNPLLFPNDNCWSLKDTKLAGVLEQPVTPQNMSIFLWYVSEMSNMAEQAELKKDLGHVCQLLQGMADKSTCQNCTLPTFQEEMHNYLFLRCLLKLLADYLKKAML